MNFKGIVVNEKDLTTKEWVDKHKQETVHITEHPTELDPDALYRIDEPFGHEGKLYDEGLYQVIDNKLKKIESAEVVDNLTSTDTDKALSSNQGKILNEKKIESSTVFNYDNPILLYNVEDEDPIYPNEWKVLVRGQIITYLESVFGEDPDGKSCAPPDTENDTFMVTVICKENYGGYPITEIYAFNNITKHMWFTWLTEDHTLEEWTIVDKYPIMKNVYLSNLTREKCFEDASLTGCAVYTYAQFVSTDRPRDRTDKFSIIATCQKSSSDYMCGFIQATSYADSTGITKLEPTIYCCSGTGMKGSVNFTDWIVIGGGSSVDIIDNLASTRTDAALSANMGKNLNDNKLNKSDVINDLTHTTTGQALSAYQGKILNDTKIDSYQSRLTGKTCYDLIDMSRKYRTKVFESVMLTSEDAPPGGYANYPFTIMVCMGEDGKGTILAISMISRLFYRAYYTGRLDGWLELPTTIDLESDYQKYLISGTNIKTVQGNDLLGSGNIDLSGSIASGNTKFVKGGDVYSELGKKVTNIGKQTGKTRNELFALCPIDNNVIGEATFASADLPPGSTTSQNFGIIIYSNTNKYGTIIATKAVDGTIYKSSNVNGSWTNWEMINTKTNVLSLSSSSGTLTTNQLALIINYHIPITVSDILYEYSSYYSTDNMIRYQALNHFNDTNKTLYEYVIYINKTTGAWNREYNAVQTTNLSVLWANQAVSHNIANLNALITEAADTLTKTNKTAGIVYTMGRMSEDIPYPETTSTTLMFRITYYNSSYVLIEATALTNAQNSYSIYKNGTTWSVWKKVGIHDSIRYQNLTIETLAQKGTGVYSYIQFTSAEAPKGSSGTSYNALVMMNPNKSWTTIWAVAQNDTAIYTTWINLSTGASAGGWTRIGGGIPESFRLEYENGALENITFLVG